MKILALSDLHGYLPEIPECDLLLLGGDYCPTRNAEQERRFLAGEFNDWLENLKAKHIVGIAGNHDFVLQEDPALGRSLSWIYLQDEEVDVDGIHIYGSPWTLPYGNWAFMESDYKLRERYLHIPKGLDILLTHGPAYRHLDQTAAYTNAGSFSLWEKIQEVKPANHVFGHIHEARGIMQHGDTMYFNVSLVNINLVPKNEATVISLESK